MDRKLLERKIGQPLRTFRKAGKVCVELASEDIDQLMKFPYVGRGDTVAEACRSFLTIHKLEG